MEISYTNRSTCPQKNNDGNSGLSLISFKILPFSHAIVFSQYKCTAWWKWHSVWWMHTKERKFRLIPEYKRIWGWHDFSHHTIQASVAHFFSQNSKPFQTQWKKAVFKYKAEKTHFPVLLSKFNSNLAFRDLESDKFSFFSKKCFPILKRVCRHLVSRF